MTGLPALVERAGAVRSRLPRLSRAAPGERFVDRPNASVQLLLIRPSGCSSSALLMAVSTTIAASADTTGAGPSSIWTQVIKEGIFLGLGLPIFWLRCGLPPRGFRVLAYPIRCSG